MSPVLDIEQIEWRSVADELPDADTTVCKRCGTAYPIKRKGRPEKYCSWNCRYNITYLCQADHEVNEANRLARKINGSRCRECARLARVRTLSTPALRQGADRENRIWRGMHHRCERSDSTSYPSYGGRGIKVCERWVLFDNFITDMGRAPGPRDQLDRIDNNGNYEPGNCRWVTPKENSANRRKPIRFHSQKLTEAIVIEILSVSLSGSELGHRLGVSRSTINRIRRGETWKHVRANLPLGPQREEKS